MPSKGTYTALQKLKPIDVDWAKAAKSGNEREDLLYNRKVAEEKLAKEARDEVDYKEQEAVITGIDTLDKGLTLGIQEASTMQHSDYKIAREDAKFADSTDYKIRTKNLNNYSKNVKSMSDGVEKLASTVISKAQEGTLSAWDDELLQTMNGAYVTEAVKFGVNPDGSVKTTIALTDQGLITDDNPRGFVKDENGKIKMKTVTPSEVFKGLGGFSITPDVDVPKLAQTLGKELGKSVTSEINAYTTTTEQLWSNKEDDVRTAIKGDLGSPNSPSALAKRIWADKMGKSSRKLKPEDMTQVEDYYLAQIQIYYDEEVKKKKDFTAQGRAIDRNDKKREGAVSPVYVKDSATGAPAITSINGVDATTISFGDGKGIMVKETEANKESYTNIYVDATGAVYADKTKQKKVKGDPPIGADGKPDLQAWALNGKGWETTESTEPEKLSEKEVTNLVTNSKMLKEDNTRFKDNKDFKDYMKAKKDKLPTGQSGANAGDSIFE